MDNTGTLLAELERLREENAQLRLKLNVYEGISANSFYMRALRGQIPAREDMRDGFSENGIDFPGERFAVAILQIIGENDRFIEEFAYGNAEKERSVADFMVENISTELINRRFYGKTVYGDGNMPCIICFDGSHDGEDAAALSGALADIAREITETLREKAGLDVCASIGLIHSGYDGMTMSYDEACRVADYRRLMEKRDPVIGFWEISHENMTKPDHLYSMDQEQRVLNCIRKGDYKTAKEHVHRLFESYFTGYVPSIQFLQCRFWGFLSNMVSMIDEFNEAGDKQLMEELDPIGLLLRSQTVNELLQRTDEVFDKFIEMMENRKKTEPPKWFGPMCRYLEQNYTDPNINISTVSAEFGVHPSYVSSIFRQYTGERMLDYIHRKRIENAKALISEGLTMSDVALRVGYGTTRAMARGFKKYEGTVPSSFK